MTEDFRLVDLEVIKRYSLAVRQEAAPAREILEALDASRLAVLAAAGPEAAPPEAPGTSARDVPLPGPPPAGAGAG